MKMVDNYLKIIFECSNCGNRFQKELPKGTATTGQAGFCPSCRVIDEATHPFKVISTIQKEILME